MTAVTPPLEWYDVLSCRGEMPGPLKCPHPGPYTLHMGTKTMILGSFEVQVVLRHEMYIYIYIHMYMYVYVYMYIYMYMYSTCIHIWGLSR